MKNIGVIGIGCVGSVIASQLADYAEAINVFLIANGSRAERLKNEGVTVNGKHHFFPVLDNPSEDIKLDLLFVCVKNFHLHQACEDMRTFVDEKTIILPLLNSVSPTPTIQALYPDNRVLYGYIQKIDAHRSKDGFCYNIAGDIHFGYAKNEVVKPELTEIQTILKETDFSAFIDVDMLHGVWKKWMLNVGANQVSALTEADYLQFAKIPEIEHILRLAMQELLTIACFEQVNLSTQDILDTLNYLTTYPYPKQTSMLQDVLAHRKTEIDYISGDIIELSKKWNCPCPVNLSMYYLIKSKEKAYLEKQSNPSNK